jgi:hypothetical protein
MLRLLPGKRDFDQTLYLSAIVCQQRELTVARKREFAQMTNPYQTDEELSGVTRRANQSVIPQKTLAQPVAHKLSPFRCQLLLHHSATQPGMTIPKSGCDTAPEQLGCRLSP